MMVIRTRVEPAPSRRQDPDVLTQAVRHPDAGNTPTHATTGSDPVAVLDKVVFGYRAGRPVVQDVCAQLNAGRICALIGPNAAGKSTLLKLILGLHKPWSGQVTALGSSIDRLSHARRARLISYVPQKGAISFAFTVRQVIAMGCYAASGSPLAADAIDRAIERCDLSDLTDRVFAELSVGQQQRVLLARAIAQSTDQGRLMLLDEPASGMDLRHVHQTMHLLKQIARGQPGSPGSAVLIVLHDLNLAARYADDAWLMDRGKLVAAGPSQEVMAPDRLANVYGVGFKTLSPPADGTSKHRAPVFWIDPPDTMD